jgi:hypothetical protein
MQKKNVTVTDLANQTNTKSRTTINRLLKDETSINVINDFKTSLLTIDPLCLSNTEIQLMNKSIVVNKFGKDVIYARRILLDLFTNYPSTSLPLDITVTNSNIESMDTTNLFNSYCSYRQVNIMIFDSTMPSLIDELVRFIQKSDFTKVSLTHMLSLNHNKSKNAEILSSIHKLINFNTYQAYLNTALTHQHISCNSDNVLSNFIVVKKTNQDGSVLTDIMKLTEDLKLFAILNAPGNDIYEFYKHYFNDLMKSSKRLRKFTGEENLPDKFLDLTTCLQFLEEGSEQYLIKQNFPLKMIPTDILTNMLSDSHHPEISIIDPRIETIINIMSERFDNYMNSDNECHNLFTKKGLIDFVMTGEISDHPHFLRPFNNKEKKQVLNYILKQKSKNNNIKLYLLKDDYSVKNLSYSYIENNVINIFDNISGYSNDLDEAVITAKPLIDIFDDFIKNELIKNQTVPETETVEFFNSLISMINEKKDEDIK